MAFLYHYLRNPNERTIGGSLAFPLHTEKKQMILTIKRIKKQIPAAIGTIMVQKRKAVIIASKVSNTTIFKDCLKWNEAYGESWLASKATIIPIVPSRYGNIAITLLSEISFALNSCV